MLKIIDDRIYGKIEIDDPVVIEIINTPTFQRLIKINQFGGVNFVFPEYQVSRYEHSIGVWWILKKLGLSKDIQVNGLLHDIAHTAFSHMVDMAKSDHSESFHENEMTNSGFMDPVNIVLRKYGFKLENPNKFPEIKKDLPDIGADRIDYAVRDYYGAIGKTTKFGEKVINNLSVTGNGIVFTKIDIARKYALMGLEAMWRVIYDPRVAVVYQSITEILRSGLQDGWITEKLLMTDDHTVFEIIKKNKGAFPKKYIKIFEFPFSAKIVKKGESYDFFHIKLKARYFDPPILVGKKTVRLSEVDSTFKKSLDEKIKIFEDRKKGVYIKVDFLNKSH